MAARLQAFLEEALEQFPNEIIITDWNGHSYTLGLKQPHWRGIPLEIHLKTKDAGRDLLSLDAMAYLDRFVAGDIDMTGNIYALAAIRDTMNLALPWWRLLPRIIAGRTYLFQNSSRARVNIKSHYDIPQEALQLYLDRVYMSYSCGMFEYPALAVDELVRVGRGQSDDFDSLEKAQWRKFKDAVDFVSPENGETLLDVGCGYAGQLRVALENYPFGKVVGWTHSHNQVVEGCKGLAAFDPARWELHEGDYRQEYRVFDHITSTGMISHVGPRGLVEMPYVAPLAYVNGILGIPPLNVDLWVLRYHRARLNSFKRHERFTMEPLGIDAFTGRQISGELVQSLVKLTPCTFRIAALAMIETDCKVNECLQKKSARPNLGCPSLFEYLVALEKLSIVEKPDSLFQ
jgi:Mycolic acid cyclopropane synthetase